MPYTLGLGLSRRAGLRSYCAVQHSRRAVGLRVVCACADEDIRRQDVAAVVAPVPVVGDCYHASLEVEAAIDAFGTRESDEVRRYVAVCACPDGSRCDARVTTE